MKKIIIILILAMVTFATADASSFSHKHKFYGKHVTISIQRFYDELAPYGDWIYSPDYGYIWRPYFEYPEAFRPYSSGGHWIYTEYGWTWMSDYPWGWATFHYGRWDFDDYLGWVWIPGYEWAPAWVSWGRYDDYWGWAPLGPRITVSVNFNWFAPSAWWTFVPYRHFCSSHWNNYIYDRAVYVNNITHITNIYNGNGNGYNGSDNRGRWFNGPRVSDVERMGSTKVRSMKVAEADRPSMAGERGNTINVYRPGVENTRSEARPVEFRNIENTRSSARVQPQSARTNNPGEFRTRETGNTTINTNNRRADSPNTVQGRAAATRSAAPATETRSAREIPDRAKPQNSVNESRSEGGSTGTTIRQQAPAQRREAPVYQGRETRNQSQAPVVREQAPAQRREAPVYSGKETRNQSQAPAARSEAPRQERQVKAQRSESPSAQPAQRNQERKADNSNRESKKEGRTPVERPSR